MASCQITITGTSGNVTIRYTIAGTDNVIIADIGDPIYIDDSSTNITYTTNSGDAVASSGCVTITNLPSTCYLFQWETYSPPCDKGEVFDAVILGATTYTIVNVSYSSSYLVLAQSIEDEDVPEIVPYSGKVDVSTSGKVKNSLVVAVLGTDIPYLRIKNPLTTFKSYLLGVSSVCQPAGYVLTNLCSNPAT